MKHFFILLSAAILLFGCEHLKKHFSDAEGTDKKVMLHKDSLNTVTMKDSMVIYESTCRGCAYEQSTHFELQDTAGIVALSHVNTYDTNPDNVDGGSVHKDLVLIPKKPGNTIIRIYKFYKEIPDPADSANFSEYRIEVKK